MAIMKKLLNELIELLSFSVMKTNTGLCYTKVHQKFKNKNELFKSSKVQTALLMNFYESQYQ